jgi:D-alanyl-D-alanine carboxypeptidase (penicillin-binding protein 5/6)
MTLGQIDPIAAPRRARSRDTGRAVLRTLAGLALALVTPALVASTAAAIETTAQEAIVVDYDTGTVLFEKNADDAVHPASMSKLMTLYVLFDRLKQGNVTLDSEFPVSEKAWALNEGSTMFVGIGEKLRVEDLIRGIIVQSGNDACLVVAEGIAGTEEGFAELMNETAVKIGLQDSHFVNSHGLEDPEHLMTVRDLAILAKHLIADFPEYYHYFSELEYEHNGIKQGNRNPLLYRDIGADGLKTGHLTVSGYGLTASAERNGRRVIVVAHGMESMQSRADQGAALIEWAFREFDNYTLAKAGATLEDAPVWYGAEETVPLVVNQDLVATLPRAARKSLEVRAVFDGPIPAPITKGQQVGKLVISAGDITPLEVPVYAGADVERLGMFGRVFATLKHFILGGGTAAEETSEEPAAS